MTSQQTRDRLVHPLRDGGGRRRFDRADIRRLSFVMIAQSLGFPLAEIRARVSVPLSLHGGTGLSADQFRGAIQAGMRYARGRDCEYVLTMDADGQHEAESIAALANPVLEDRADIAIGTCPDRGSLMRRIAWVLMKRASGLTLEDITSGFRLYCREAVDVLARKSATLLE